MSKLQERLYVWGAIASVAILLALMVISGPTASNAAPMGAPTPVTFSNNGSRATAPRLAVFNSGTPVAALTPVTTCYDMREYSTMDLAWVAAQAATITLTLKGGNDTTNLFSEQVLINANATPISNFQQYPLFGVNQCITLQSVNATPVSVYVKGLAK